MKSAVTVMVWIGIIICFIRGLFAFDMGGSAKDTYPVAGGICLAGSVVAASVMMVFHALTASSDKEQ